MIGIIGAMQVEVDELLGALQQKRIKRIAKTEYCEGLLSGGAVVVVCCGIGKVNAAMTASFLLASYPEVHTVVNLGVAGGIGQGVKVGDIVVSDNCMQYDFNSSFDIQKRCVLERIGLRNIPSHAETTQSLANTIKRLGFGCHIGTIATGDKFVADRSFAQSIANDYNAIAIDMESGAIAQVCWLADINFVSVRTISDSGDDNAKFDFDQNMKATAERSCKILMEWSCSQHVVDYNEN